MSWKFHTVWIIIAVSILLVAWDIVVAIKAKGLKQRATISNVILDTARKHPILPFAFGVLMGHFFWQQ